MSNSTEYIIKLTTDSTYSSLFLQRFTNYFNKIFSYFYNGGVYFEIIEGGILMFCESKNLLSLLLTPFDRKLIGKLKKKPLEKNNLLDPRLNAKSFPKEGLLLDFEFKTDYPADIYEYYENFYPSIDNEIEVSEMPPHIIVRFPTWRIFKLYVDLIEKTYEQFTL